MRSVIKRNQVEVDEAPATRARQRNADDGAARKNGSHEAANARVRLIRIDSQVQVLEFTCACGEVSLIEIQCEKAS